MNAARFPVFVSMLIVSASPVAAKDRSAPAAPQAPDAWVTADDYPATALREGREGVSAIRWDISVEGKAENCTIVAGSGSPDLDQAACAAITSRARYVPALDRRGKPVRSFAQRRVRWAIPIAQQDTIVPYTLRGL